MSFNFCEACTLLFLFYSDLIHYRRKQQATTKFTISATINAKRTYSLSVRREHGKEDATSGVSSSGKHSEGPEFKSWFDQVEVETSVKALNMHVQTTLRCKMDTRL